MKEIITNTVLFVVFAIVFSSLTGCKDGNATQSNVNGTNAPASPVETEQAKSDSKSSAYPPLAAGVADADIELTDGTKTKVSDRKGKVILLNLWGIWCGPCRAEMPDLVKLQDQYKDKGFEVLGLNIGADDAGTPENLNAIKTFGEKNNINYTLARISQAATNQVYLVTRQQAVPQTLLVDREGHLRGVFIGGGPTVMAKIKETVANTVAE